MEERGFGYQVEEAQGRKTQIPHTALFSGDSSPIHRVKYTLNKTGFLTSRTLPKPLSLDLYNGPKLLTSKSTSKITLNQSNRGQSDLGSPSSAKFQSFRSVTVQTKFEILHLIGDLKKHAGPPTSKLAKGVFKVLETIANEKGVYSEEMQCVVNELTTIVYCPRSDLPDWLVSQAIDLLIEDDGLFPYFNITKRLFQEVETMRKLADLEKRKSTASVESLEERLKVKDEEINGLKRDIYELREKLQPLERSVIALQNENSNLKDQVQDFQTQVIKATEKYKVAKLSLAQDLNHINTLLHTLQQIKQSSAERSIAYDDLEGEHSKLIQENEEMKYKHQMAMTKLAEIAKENEELIEEKRVAELAASSLRKSAESEAKKLRPSPRGSFNRGPETLLVPDPTQSARTNISDVSRFLRELKARFETNCTPAKDATKA